jgi:hypothetical protein
MEDTYTMIPAKNDPQGLGSAITYQRRYSLGAVLGLNIDNDDDGNATSSPAEAPKVTADPLSKEGRIYAELRGKIAAEDDFGKLESYKASLMEKSDIVTPVQYKDLIERIDKKIKKSNLKETKQESRQTAETDIVEDTTIELENEPQ